MSRHSLVAWLLFACGACVAGVGCRSSSGGSSSGGSGGGAVGEHDDVAATATAGGTLRGTGVTVSIPPGALAADTTLTLEIKDKAAYPEAESIPVNVFDFGPNGTTFAKPVTMTIDLAGNQPPQGKTAAIAYYDGKAWQRLGDSATANGKVTATTTHFTPFTVVWTGGQQTSGGCSALAFTPCGGSLVGTWTYTAACADITPGSADPTQGKCPTATATATADVSGSITFNADGTFTQTQTQSSSVVVDIPASCIPALGQTCAQAGGTLDASGNCVETHSQPAQSKPGSGTYSTTATTLTTTDTDGGPGAPVDYCVQGATLKARLVPSGPVNGTTIRLDQVIFVATKT